MILRQILHTSPAIASSYLFGCGSKSVGVVVDPVAKPEFYLDSAAELGMQVRYVIDTHIHADHLSTGRALADAADAVYVLHESVDATFPFQRVDDGDRVEIGSSGGEHDRRRKTGTPSDAAPDDQRERPVAMA